MRPAPGRDAGEAGAFQRIRRGAQFARRQVQVDHRVARVGVPQQGLDDGQLGAAVEQVGGETVAERVRVDGLGDAGPPGGFPAGVPDGFLRDRLVGASRLQTRKEPAVASLHGAIVGPELVEQFRAERHLAVFAAFALADADHHALLVDVLGPEVAQLGAAHAGGVERHQNGAVAQIGGGVDQAGDFVRAQARSGICRRSSLGQRQVVAREKR